MNYAFVDVSFRLTLQVSTWSICNWEQSVCNSHGTAMQGYIALPFYLPYYCNDYIWLLVWWWQCKVIVEKKTCCINSLINCRIGQWTSNVFHAFHPNRGHHIVIVMSIFLCEFYSGFNLLKPGRGLGHGGRQRTSADLLHWPQSQQAPQPRYEKW